MSMYDEYRGDNGEYDQKTGSTGLYSPADEWFVPVDGTPGIEWPIHIFIVNETEDVDEKTGDSKNCDVRPYVHERNGSSRHSQRQEISENGNHRRQCAGLYPAQYENIF